MALGVKNMLAIARDLRDASSIPELERAPGGRHGNPLQYSCLENPMDRGSLAGYSPQDHKESDTTERLNNNPHTALLHPRGFEIT